MLGSISIPFLLSFDKKVAFYKYWPALLPSILITGAFFASFDIYFAAKGIWGFNPLYHSGIVWARLPLEEWLFFIFIPYASIFIHFVLKAYFPLIILTDKTTRIITVTLILILASALFAEHDKVYSVTYFSLMAIILLISVLQKGKILNSLYISFLVILIPFIMVNGILTGSLIEGEVVWYNPDEISGIRLITIPVEDFAYGFSLIFINLLFMDYFQRIISTRKIK
jgi:lycopene cyclase domain-containing protein